MLLPVSLARRRRILLNGSGRVAASRGDISLTLTAD